MRADQQVCVAVGGDTFQIACEDTAVIASLREWLSELVVDEAALPGFKINPPEPGNKMWVLLGTNGGVLARARNAEGVMRSLLRHVGALSKSEEATGFRSLFHAVVSDDWAVLVEPALLRAQPLVEKQAARKGLALVDSSYVTIADDLTRLLPIPSSPLEPAGQDVGHASPTTTDQQIRGVLWPAADTEQDPTLGQLAHAFASTTRSGSRADRIETGIRMAETLSVTLVPAQGRNVLLPAVQDVLAS